ncbi:hypothetical protein [Streptomyces noursei]|uniref:hypothetical protein n=1 Tax=Streptomyces noursei TaxID=1971 RepID=UPI001F04F1D0|nr:hypothetical protein [Streptomyces noursei]
MGVAGGAAGDALAAGRPRTVTQPAVDAEAERLRRGLIALRQDLHRHPEAPGQERRTAGPGPRPGDDRGAGRAGYRTAAGLRDRCARHGDTAFPFNGEDFALYLDRVPGTYPFLGVRAPNSPLTTCYPHYPDFAPDERAIGIGVRAMAGWIAQRAASASH